ncbi:MAG: hypothetical protein ABI560_04745 [Myxococcales bacterium]
MQAYKLQVKIFAVPSTGPTPSLETFIPVLHRWIKDHVLRELMIDVANYAHVPDGPGVVLIGHGSDTFIDETGGRRGVMHSRKREAPAPEERLGDAFRRALHAAMLLETEPALAGTVRFSPNEFLFRINDRLLAPNTDQTFAAVKAELDTLAARMFEGPYELGRVGDAKSLFSVKLVSPAPSTLATLLSRLGGPPAASQAAPVPK